MAQFGLVKPEIVPQTFLCCLDHCSAGASLYIVYMYYVTCDIFYYALQVLDENWKRFTVTLNNGFIRIHIIKIKW